MTFWFTLPPEQNTCGMCAEYSPNFARTSFSSKEHRHLPGIHHQQYWHMHGWWKGQGRKRMAYTYLCWGVAAITGIHNFFCRFIRKFSLVAAPLMSLLKGKPRQWKWDSRAEEAFKVLKVAFTSAPILQHPGPSQPFVVEASKMGVGAILSQHQPENNKQRHTKADAMSRMHHKEVERNCTETILP